MNLNKREEHTTDKSSEGIDKGGNGKKGNGDKGAEEEGIVIEQGNIETAETKEASSQYSGALIKVNNEDPAADALADRIGGEARVRFANDPNRREFDVISPDYIAQAKPDLKSYGKQ